MIYDYPMQQESAAHEERIESIIEYIADDLCKYVLLYLNGDNNKER